MQSYSSKNTFKPLKQIYNYVYKTFHRQVFTVFNQKGIRFLYLDKVFFYNCFTYIA